MPPKHGRNPNRKSRKTREFHWLPKPLDSISFKKRISNVKNRAGSKLRFSDREIAVDKMIRSSFSVAEILSELNLHVNQLHRHLANLRRKYPLESWRYEKLLNNRKKIEAYKTNLVYNLRFEGLTLPEIEGLMGLDWGNSDSYLNSLKRSAKSEFTKEMLSGEPLHKGEIKTGKNYLLAREEIVVRTVYGDAKKSKISRVRKRAELLLPKLKGFDKTRMQIAINTLKQLEESAKF